MSFGPSDPLLGKTIVGRYRVDARLGEGGIGAVYIAEHLALGKRVALKVLHDRIAATTNARERFEREARALSKLAHPNVVTVIDFGTEGEQLFLVMELVDGDALSDRLRRGRIPRALAFDVMRQILRALAYAHGLGIVHRDLKPANVLVRSLPDGTEHVTVLDFGLAKFVDAGGEPGEPGVTRQGAILGTPAYMAPEQATGDAAGPAADVYSATLMLFELLTGERAYAGREAGELLKAHLIAPIPTLSATRNDLPFSPELEAFVKRGLAKRAADRFANAREMLDAFDALPESRGAVVDPQVATTVVGRPRPPITDATESSGGSRAILIAMALIGVAGIGAMAYLAHTFLGDPDPVPVRTRAIDAGVDSERVAEAVDAGSDAAVDAAIDGSIADAGELDAGIDGGEEDAGTDAGVALVDPNRVPARDPFAVGVPAELAPLNDAIARGEQPSRETLQVLYRYAAGHPTDPRAHLLLGHTYADRGWANDALDSYREAHFRDPSSRGDRRMLRDLVTMAANKRSDARARGYVVGFYGSEALATVTETLGSTTDPEARVLLERLRTELATAP